MAANALAHYKVLAGKLADMAMAHGPRTAAQETMLRRKTRGTEAALVASLVCGSLIEHGKPDLAMDYTIALHAELCLE